MRCCSESSAAAPDPAAARPADDMSSGLLATRTSSASTSGTSCLASSSPSPLSLLRLTLGACSTSDTRAAQEVSPRRPRMGTATESAEIALLAKSDTSSAPSAEILRAALCAMPATLLRPNLAGSGAEPLVMATATGLRGTSASAELAEATETIAATVSALAPPPAPTAAAAAVADKRRPSRTASLLPLLESATTRPLPLPPRLSCQRPTGKSCGAAAAVSTSPKAALELRLRLPAPPPLTGCGSCHSAGAAATAAAGGA